MDRDAASFQVMALSGSLRTASSNTALLQAAAVLAPSSLRISLYRSWAELPPFTPDAEGAEPAAVLVFRAALQEADAVLIASPEYAHGLPGAFKNALDWVVGSGEFINKPVAALNASGRATHAQASLLDTLAMMNADVVSAASAVVALPTNKLDAAAMLADATIAGKLHLALAALAGHLGRRLAPGRSTAS